MITCASMAQDTNSTFSKVEIFCHSSGKIIKGHVMYSDNYVTHYTPTFISLTKYVDYEGRDTLFGISFYGNTARKSYNVILDYEETARIISWIDFVKREINNYSHDDYISYSPKRGRLLLFVKKINSNPKWRFEIQYDKSDISSLVDCNIGYLDELNLRLTAIQKAKNDDNK